MTLLAMSPLEVELAEIEDRIRDARAELAEARSAADDARAAYLLEQAGDGEAMATTRAVVAWMADEVAVLEHNRQILRHRIGLTK